MIVYIYHKHKTKVNSLITTEEYWQEVLYMTLDVMWGVSCFLYNVVGEWCFLLGQENLEVVRYSLIMFPGICLFG